MVVDHTIIARHDWAVGSASSFHHWDMSIKIHPTHVKNNYSLYSLGSRNHLWVFIFFFSSNILSPSIGCYEYLCVLLLQGMNPSTHWSCTIAPILKRIINITPTLHMEGRRGSETYGQQLTTCLWWARKVFHIITLGFSNGKLGFHFPLALGFVLNYHLTEMINGNWVVLKIGMDQYAKCV